MLHRPIPRQGRSRPGLSLLEVLISLTIFLLALVALGEIVSFASDRALDVQHRTEALQLCQSRLAELQAGALPLSQQDETPCQEDPAYQWAADIQQGNIQGLQIVTVRVTRHRPNGTWIEASLSQMILDPATVGSTQDNPGIPATTTDSSTTGSSTTGTSGTTGTGTTNTGR